MNPSNLAKYILGAGIIAGILIILNNILFVGIVEKGDTASAIIGGALITILLIVVQFFFRKATEKEKEV